MFRCLRAFQTECFIIFLMSIKIADLPLDFQIQLQLMKSSVSSTLRLTYSIESIVALNF